MPGPNQAAVRVIDVRPKLPEGVEALSPVVLIEPKEGAPPPRGIRMRLPDDVTLDAGQADRVALAFNGLGYAQSQRVVHATWHVHAAKFDPKTRTVQAPVSHACLWIIVMPKNKRHTLLGDHFTIHFWPKQVDKEQAIQSNRVLEKAFRRLESFGLRFGRSADDPLDVYFDTLSVGNDDVVYARHSLAKGGGTYITINLPRNIPRFNPRELRVTLGHELFHELQYKYQNISTFKDVHLPGLQRISTKWYTPGGWLADKVFGLSKYDYPYGWLNEAMSTWFQLQFDPQWQPDMDDPLYGNVYDFLTTGLGRLHTDNGYGGAVFIDYMVRRCGTSFIKETLEACKKQGRNRNALAAVKDACLRCAVLRNDPKLATFDSVWYSFASDLLLEDAKYFDARLDRRRMAPSSHGGPGVTAVGTTPVKKTFTTSVHALSARLKAYLLEPAERTGGTARIICTIRRTVQPEPPFVIWTALFASPGQSGSRAAVPSGIGRAGILLPRSPSKTLVLDIPKGQRAAIVRLLTIGVWGGKVPKRDAVCPVSYELTFLLDTRKPDDFSAFFPEVKYFPGYHKPWRISRGSVKDPKTKRPRSVNRAYFYAERKPGGGRPDILHLFRVKIDITNAPELADARYESRLKKYRADKRVVGLAPVSLAEKSVAFARKGVREFYDKQTQTCDVVLLKEDRYVAEVSWSCFKKLDLWANRRAITHAMAKEVAERIRGTFHGVLPEPPGGNALARAAQDAAAIAGPAEAEAVKLYALSLSHASTQRFHEPWFDKIVALQASAEKEVEELVPKVEAIVAPVAIASRHDGRFRDPERVVKAMAQRQDRLLDKPKLTDKEKEETEAYGEKLAVVKRVAALARIALAVRREWAKVGLLGADRGKILTPHGGGLHGGRGGYKFGKTHWRLVAPALYPNAANDPDPAKAGTPDKVTAAKRQIRLKSHHVKKPEPMRKALADYCRTVAVINAVSKLQSQVDRYNEVVATYDARVGKGDFRMYVSEINALGTAK